jgi:hypothetical protein
VPGLRWRDLDLDANRVSVRRTVNQIKGVGLVLRATPKNKSSRRSVTLPRAPAPPFVRHVQRRLSSACLRAQHGPTWT